VKDEPFVKSPHAPQSVMVGDLRGVPLDQLAHDPDALKLVRKVLDDMEGPSRVMVAAFSSAI